MSRRHLATARSTTIPAAARLRRKGLLAAALLAAGLAVAALTGGPLPGAHAASGAAILKSFDPGDIISDAVMFNPGTMSASAVQSFLNEQVPSCRSGYTCLKSYRQSTRTLGADPMCAQYTGASNETAASIITKVARACGVNPQVLLVVLQKEQGLVTDTWPVASQYRKATGYGCPDSASVCDATYNGFFNQVYKAAWALKRYTSPPGTSGPGWTSYTWLPVGRTSHVLYNPNVACGSMSLVIRNKATASLYYYTPYVPNAAALGAGFGTGDRCSAYGNRNFFLYFTTWFGSTHYVATGATGALWQAMGGTSGSLGAPTGNASKVSGGTVQPFEKGVIYSSTKGTFALAGTFLSAYQAAGGPSGALGWPTTGARVSNVQGGGDIQTFTGGAIYAASGHPAVALSGPISREFLRRGGVAGSLGWPTGTAVTTGANGGGTSQQFQSGLIYASHAGAYAVRLDMLHEYLRLGGPSGALGWPAATATARGYSANGGGQGQRFTGGTVYYTAKLGAVGVTGAIDHEYRRRGGVAGSLGWPAHAASSTSANGGGTSQEFQSGLIYASHAGAYAVRLDMLREYQRLGGPAGALGWPTATATGRGYTAHGGGQGQTFTGGTVYYTAKLGAVGVTGAIEHEYRRRGGVAGSLGWPTRPASTSSANGGGTSQEFQSGLVYASRAGAYAVRLDMLHEYLRTGGPGGDLGWPAATATGRGYTAHGGGQGQRFTGGTIYYTKHLGAIAVTGATDREYVRRGGVAGSLGWPTHPAASTSANGGGTSQRFQSGLIYASKAGAYAVRLDMLQAYERQGGPAGALGWPTATATGHGYTARGGGQGQTFTGGTIYYTTRLGAVAVTGALHAEYLRRGGVAGELGWPVASAVVDARTGSATQRFEGGTLALAGPTPTPTPTS